jgi:hypothetical protein
MKPAARRPSAALALLAGLALLSACDMLDARERFVMATDQASRYSFRYVQDRETKLWVHLHCEIRVPVARKLPDPITSSETGDLLHFTEFGSGTMGSAGVDKNEQEIRDGYRVWLYRVTTGEDHYKGHAGFGISVTWPDPGKETRYEPSENFNLPALNSMTPYVWTPWRKADEVRGGAFADWERVQGRPASDPAQAAPEPFEMRCRPVLSDALFIPIVAEDANVRKPDPSQH